VVVDNGSTDGSAEVARRWGAHVVREAIPGYGAAVHTGLLAATSEIVAVLDADGSLDPAELPQMVRQVRSGGADMVLGRRVPSGRGAWPWHARAGNAALAALLRHRGLPVRDIGPIRVARRADLLALGVCDRGFRLSTRTAPACPSRPLATGRGRGGLPAPCRRHHLEGVRLGAGYGTRRPRHDGRPAVTRFSALVVAKAPVAGLAKTRLTPPATPREAAAIAAAALLDTLRAVQDTPGAVPMVALTGDVAAGQEAAQVRDRDQPRLPGDDDSATQMIATHVGPTPSARDDCGSAIGPIGPTPPARGGHLLNSEFRPDNLVFLHFCLSL
jgi:Glycosyl transferase family 2